MPVIAHVAGNGNLRIGRDCGRTLAGASAVRMILAYGAPGGLNSPRFR